MLALLNLAKCPRTASHVHKLF